ncbi:uncharacterized protein LOC143901463 [Temnothorax americanus]|uniref:uncharacterized protein LOC143901463 n=1 Tax=Temnothorax americanus TaxID=1964332 RepID=UPI0040682FC3
MEDVEHFIKVMQQKRLAKQRELDRLDTETSEYDKLLKELQDLRKDREQCKENIAKHFSTITSHKHSIQKMVNSTKDVSGLPVPHDFAENVATMFTDAIQLLNNVGDLHKALTNDKEDNVDPLKLIQAVTTCTEAVGNKLYQTRCSIAQLETLKENVVALQEYILDNSDNIEDESTSSTVNGDSMDSVNGDSTVT